MIKLQVVIIYFLVFTNLLYAENIYERRDTITEGKRKWYDLVIATHYASVPNILNVKKFSKTQDVNKILKIANFCMKCNIEKPLYEGFYLKTYFFNNRIHIGYPKTPHEKKIYIEMFALAIGKNISYNKSKNMFSIELCFYIDENIENKTEENIENKIEDNTENKIAKENFIFKIISKFAIVLELYKKTFTNKIYISFGHIVINIVSLYDFVRYDEKKRIFLDYFMVILANILSLNLGYDFS